MARILIAPAGHRGPQLEVEQSAFDNGFYPGYVYVADATPAASSEATAEEQRVAGFVTGGTVLPAALRAAFDARYDPIGAAVGMALVLGG